VKRFHQPCVSIPQWCDCCDKKYNRCCWKIEVSIPQWCDCCVMMKRHGERTKEFQSHNGAIAAIRELVRRRMAVSFQSHNGAIAAIQPAVTEQPKPSVSIPQWCDCCPTWLLDEIRWAYSFNPTMVRLLRLCSNWKKNISNSVSIPQWCDCCPHSRNRQKCQQNSFNPTMVRLLQIETPPTKRDRCRFQSHNGAIAARRRQ